MVFVTEGKRRFHSHIQAGGREGSSLEVTDNPEFMDVSEPPGTTEGVSGWVVTRYDRECEWVGGEQV